jgi:hypothetical protein
MNDDKGYFGATLMVTGEVVYVGADGWEPDPVELAITILFFEMIREREKQRCQDLRKDS